MTIQQIDDKLQKLRDQYPDASAAKQKLLTLQARPLAHARRLIEEREHTARIQTTIDTTVKHARGGA